MKIIKKWFCGFKYPYKGFLFIFTQPEISKIVSIQFLLNIITFIIVFSSSFYILVRWLNSIISYGNIWYEHIIYYFGIILGIAAIIIISVIFSGFLSGLIGGGLNSNLSEKTEEILKQQKNNIQVSFIEGLFRDIGFELKSLTLIIAVFLLLSLVNIIPIIGTIIFFVLTFIYSIFAISFKYLDYVMELRKFSFKKKLLTVWNSGPLFMGFGFSALLLFQIPIINLLMHSIGIISGTLLYLEEIEK